VLNLVYDKKAEYKKGQIYRLKQIYIDNFNNILKSKQSQVVDRKLTLISKPELITTHDIINRYNKIYTISTKSINYFHSLKIQTDLDNNFSIEPDGGDPYFVLSTPLFKEYTPFAYLSFHINSKREGQMQFYYATTSFTEADSLFFKIKKGYHHYLIKLLPVSLNALRFDPPFKIDMMNIEIYSDPVTMSDKNQIKSSPN